VALGRKHSAELRLIHVVKGERAAPDASARVRQTRELDQLELLAARASSEWPASIRIVTGDPGDEIAVDAAESRTSIVVMGLKSGGGLFSQRPGAVAYKVMCLSAVPVLAVVPHR
jgi:universal stress protein family protein